MEEKLTQNRINELKGALPEGWSVVEDKELAAEFKFSDFREAMEFVNTVAELAEEANHHPDISISYNKVRLDLSTHSAGGLTEADVALVDKIHEKTS